jgi:hypothetical protein
MGDSQPQLHKKVITVTIQISIVTNTLQRDNGADEVHTTLSDAEYNVDDSTQNDEFGQPG